MNSTFKRPLAAFATALTLSIATLWSSGAGAVTDIATAPLFTSTTTVVKPNVLFILDDSGSMAWDFLPDDANFRTRLTTNNGNYVGIGQYGIRTSQCNGVAFNPDSGKAPYLPPVDANGNSMSAGSTSFLTSGNAYSNTDYHRLVSPSTIAVQSSGSLSVTVTVSGRQSSWYPIGSVVSVFTSGSGSKYMVGKVTSWDAGSGALVIDVAMSVGTGSVTNATVGVGAPANQVYYTYSGSQTAMDYRYPGNALDTSSTFYRECASEIGVAPGAGVFTAVIMTPSSPDAQRYANWYRYYRTRMEMMKAAASHAFKSMDDKYRIGFSTIHDKGSTESSEFLNVRDFDAAQKTTFYSNLHGSTPGGSTPLRGALTKAGRYYAKELSNQSYDPVQYSCQKNFTILSTDGYWNTGDEDTSVGFSAYQLNGTTRVGNQDGGATARPMFDGNLSTSTIRETWNEVTKFDRTTRTPRTSTTITEQTVTTRTPYQGQSRKSYSLTTYPPRANDSIQRCGGGGGSCVIRVTLSAPHNLSTGNTVTVSGASPVAYNGTFTITKYSNYAYEYTLPSRPASNTNPGTTWTAAYSQVGCGANEGKQSEQLQTRDLRHVSQTLNRTTTVTPSEQTQVAHLTQTTPYTRTVTSVNGVTSSDTTTAGSTTTNTVTDPATSVNGTPTTSSTSNTTAAADDATAWVNSGAATVLPACVTTASAATAAVNLGSVTTATATTTSPATTTGPTVVSGASTTTDSPPEKTVGTKTTTTTSSSSGGSSDSLADIAMYYYQTDLRSSGAKCTGALGKDVCENDVRPIGKDNASHQHMSTFTLSLGNSGTLRYDPNYETQSTGDFKDVTTGAKNWPVPRSDGGAVNIDDLWHAAVNGRGRYFSATDPSSLAASLNAALSSITAVTGSSSAAATSTLQPVQGDNGVFIAQFRSAEWTGDLRAYLMNVDTGEITTSTLDGNGNRVDTATWSAGDKLTTSYARTIYYADSTGKLAPFTTTMNDGDKSTYFANACSKAEPLSQCAGLAGAALAAVNSSDNMITFLRGQAQSQYRTRAKVLGDIVNSSPVYVGRSELDYPGASYMEFKTKTRERKPTIYIGANDGMLHAFNAEDGTERWAYVPRLVMPNLYKLADQFYESKHLYFVDAAPVVGDAYLPGKGWRTILVGGLGGGGRGYYALDITDPLAPEALWEFSHARMGLSFGNPVITKNKDGKWIVAVTSGYNNGGDGYLFMLDAEKGTIEGEPIMVPGSDGLNKLNAWVDSSTENRATRFYSGDLNGNLWRIDADSGKSVSLAQLNFEGKAQSITTQPQLAEVEANGTKVAVVYVGTGRYLGKTDIATTDQQSVYAIKDTLSDSGLGLDARNTLVKQPVDISATPRKVGGELVDWSTKDGWYFDLGTTSERVNVDMQLAFNTLTVAANMPGSAASDCTAAGSGNSWLYQVDIVSGKGQSVSMGAMVAGLASVQLPKGTGITIVTKTDASQQTLTAAAGQPQSGSARRTSWRELID